MGNLNLLQIVKLGAFSIYILLHVNPWRKTDHLHIVHPNNQSDTDGSRSISTNNHCLSNGAITGSFCVCKWLPVHFPYVTRQMSTWPQGIPWFIQIMIRMIEESSLIGDNRKDCALIIHYRDCIISVGFSFTHHAFSLMAHSKRHEIQRAICLRSPTSASANLGWYMQQSADCCQTD